MLVRHSLPVVEPDVQPSRWVLSEEGRRRCVALADHIARFEPFTLYASTEPKATETAEIVSQNNGVGLRVLEGLEEHHREDAPFFQDPGDFDDAVRSLFDKPNELVFGHETAAAALARFERALATVMDAATDPNVVVVSHGTVISLLVARRTGLDPVETCEIWRGLTTPCYVVLGLPDFELLDIVSDIA